MKAWQVVRAGEPAAALQIDELRLPDPPPGFLRVRVEACGLGLPDVLLCRGSYALTPEYPFSPGQELAGEVLAAGEGATTPVGARVMAVSGFFLRWGACAEEAWALDDFCFPIPEDMGAVEAAAFAISAHTAWVGLVRRAGLVAGENLLVTGGAGGTGSTAIQLGRAVGARVFATARSQARRDFCRELGADVVIDPSQADWPAALREATGGKGVDVVYDTVGGEVFEGASRAMAHEGRLLAIGFASGRWGQPDPAHMVMHNYSVIGVLPGGYDRRLRDQAQQELLAHRARGALRMALELPVPFEELPEALERLGAGGVQGKLVLDVSGAAS